MKKSFAVLLSILMIFVMGITAMAAPNNFVGSPSGNKYPEIVDGGLIEDESSVEIIVKPYADRFNLDDESRKQLEDAYDIIVDTPDLTDLNVDLKNKANTMGIDSNDIDVSDLFDVDYSDNETNEEYGEYKLRLKSDVLENFVGLLHFDGNNWTMIDNATIDEDGYLVYSTDKTGSFAIVVNTFEDGSSSGNGPQTGDDFHWWIYIALMAVSAVALVIIALKLKKTEGK